MFNCKKLFKLQVRPPSLILLIATSQDRWIFPSQSWEVKNSIITIIPINPKILRWQPLRQLNTIVKIALYLIDTQIFNLFPEGIFESVVGALIVQRNVVLQDTVSFTVNRLLFRNPFIFYSTRHIIFVCSFKIMNFKNISFYNLASLQS